MFIDFLHCFVIDHINCYYFRLMTYSIGRKYHCEAKGKDSESQPFGVTRWVACISGESADEWQQYTISYAVCGCINNSVYLCYCTIQPR